MTENKIFAGPRLRRLRQSLQLTQSAMARQLAISPSYLNLIERNQRPLTVQLLLKLSSTYDIDLGSLHDDQRPISIAELNKIFADPLLAGELPSNSELVDLIDQHRVGVLGHRPGDTLGLSEGEREAHVRVEVA